MANEHEIDWHPTMLRQIRPDAFALPAAPEPTDPNLTHRSVSEVIEANTRKRLMEGME